MTPDQFFAKFALFADTPNAVAKMRELILDLAVSGRLLCEISTDSLVSNGTDAGIDSNSESLPNLPHYWHWAPLGRIVTRMDSGWSPACSPEPAKSDEWGVLKTTAVQVQRYLEFENKALPSNLEPRPEHEILDGDILITRAGPTNRVGIVCVARPTRTKLMISDKIIRFHLIDAVDPDFAALALNSGFSKISIHQLKSGMAASQVNISQPKLKTVQMPIPPLAEQKRIVAKVDELMALCDQLESQQKQRETKKATLVQAALTRFTDAPTPANLEFLFHKSYAIEPAELRKTILTLAVAGKLVPQDPIDESATELLSRIQIEKNTLNDKGELKADKKTWVGSLTEPPHEIPATWCWVRLQDLFEISRGGSPRPAGDPRYFGGSIPWVTVGEITKDGEKYLTTTTTGLTEEGASRSRYINPGDLLLTNSGATLGVPKISLIRGCMNDGVAVLRQFHSFNLNDFAYLYLSAQTLAFRRVNQGMGQPNLNTPIIAGWFFPLPPLAEQKRIVAKVEELMALVDKLEAQLAASRDAGAKLMEAVVAAIAAAA